MKIIITGKMATGKTALAKHLVTYHHFKKIGLADPIKEIEADIEILPPTEIVNKHLEILDPMQKAMFCKIIEEAKKIPREDPKPRKRLQFIGTDGARKRIADDIWIQVAAHRASLYENVCIDDVRFLNEFDYFKAHNWTSVAVVTDLDIQWRRITSLYGNIDSSVLRHASEIEVEEIIRHRKCDFLIDTTDTTDAEAGVILMEMLKL